MKTAIILGLADGRSFSSSDNPVIVIVGIVILGVIMFGGIYLLNRREEKKSSKA